MSDHNSIIDVDLDYPNPYNFSTSEASRGNVLVVGQTSSGKTKLACGIADILMKCGWDVVVFDPVGVFRKKSSIPYYQKLHEGKVNCLKLVSPGIVFDMSNLYIDSQKELVNNFCKWLWESRVNEDPDKLRPLMIILEEAQIYTRNIKSETAQELFRLAMAGRNISVRLALLSPRLNNISTEFIFLATQRFIGLSNEENVSRKIRAMYGKTIAEQCKFLNIGEFIYGNRSDKPYWIKVPEFFSNRKPVAIDAKTKGRVMGPSMEDFDDSPTVVSLQQFSMTGLTALLLLLSIVVFIRYLI